MGFDPNAVQSCLHFITVLFVTTGTFRKKRDFPCDMIIQAGSISELWNMFPHCHHPPTTNNKYIPAVLSTIPHSNISKVTKVHGFRLNDLFLRGRISDTPRLIWLSLVWKKVYSEKPCPCPYHKNKLSLKIQTRALLFKCHTWRQPPFKVYFWS